MQDCKGDAWCESYRSRPVTMRYICKARTVFQKRTRKTVLANNFIGVCVSGKNWYWGRYVGIVFKCFEEVGMSG